MSTFRVPLTIIKAINPHPAADKLEIAKVYDWDIVVQKNMYKPGDIVVYVPVDSVLPKELETQLFPPDSKIKLHKSRIRSIRIRGVISQGMLINTMELPYSIQLHTLETDLSEALGIKKYEEPVKETPSLMKLGVPARNPYKVKEFKEYTEVEHGKYYGDELKEGEPVVVTCKLHGTAARYGWFKREPVTLLDKVRKFFGILPEWQFCWGSRRVQIQAKPDKKHSGFKSEKQGVEFGDVYTKIKEQYKLEVRIPKGYAVYGEIVGPGIQKDYCYGLASGNHEFYVYDVMHNGKWLEHREMQEFCEQYGFTPVPLMYTGPYSKAVIEMYLAHNPISHETNEGIVVKPLPERTSPKCGRLLLKYINPEYYLKNNSDFH